MKLYMPTKVYNEKGCVRQHSQELAELGTKALLVTGKHSSRVNGSLQDVEDALNREQVPYVIFDGIEENPSVETVMRATALGLSEKVDFVIGIGGGSPMDASKAIALMIANPEKKADFLYETDAAVKQAANKALTVAAVPTTAGTGSEVTPYAILTRIVMPKIELTTAAASETSTEAKAGKGPGGLCPSGKTDEAKHQPSYFPRACIGGFCVSADCFQNRLHQHGGGYVSTSGGEPFKHERYALQPCLQRDGPADLCKGKGCARFL